jgi:hypothetical protein
MPDAPPVGKRFAHVYIPRGEPEQDSERMRRRLAALIVDFRDMEGFSHFLPGELGVDVPYLGGGSLPDWKMFFGKCELRDLLCSVTLAYGYLTKTRKVQYEPNSGERWRREVQRIFEEENVHYRVDERGGVHFHLDAQFAGDRAATIAALQDSRYRATLTYFEDGMAALAKAPPDSKGAIRSTFFAAEELFKLMFANAPRLTAQEASKLEPLLQRAPAADDLAKRVANKLQPFGRRDRGR